MAIGDEIAEPLELDDVAGGRRNERRLDAASGERLERGGRFAIILGESGSPQYASGRKFWQSLLPDIRLRASIELPGREYYRNGTTVGVTLLLGSKLLSRESQETRSVEEPIRISASTVEVAFNQALTAGLRF